MTRSQRTDEPNEWMLDALCAQIGGDSFFPGETNDNYRTARRICGQCDVAEQCLAYIMRTEPAGDRNGFFAGLTANQRHELAQQKKGRS